MTTGPVSSGAGRRPVSMPAGEPPGMVAFGRLRVRPDTIRLYGVAQEDRWRLKVYERDTSPPRRFCEWLFPERRWCWRGKTAPAEGPEDWQGQQLVLEDGQIHRAAQGRPGQPEDLIHQKIELLYVVTDQGDQLRFYAGDAPFDLWEKCRELDGYLLPGGKQQA